MIVEIAAITAAAAVIACDALANYVENEGLDLAADAAAAMNDTGLTDDASEE